MSKVKVERSPKSRFKGEKVEAAREVKGRVKLALNRQLGRGGKTGGRLGDATNHPQSGVNGGEDN